jgi:hypothetical protein
MKKCAGLEKIVCSFVTPQREAGSGPTKSPDGLAPTNIYEG